MTMEFSGLDEAMGHVERAVDGAIEESVANAAEVITFAARADHPYTDRTEQLTQSIEALPAVRSGELVHGGVIAGMPYAQYVERSHPYLEPAAARSEARIDHDTEEILRRRVT